MSIVISTVNCPEEVKNKLSQEEKYLHSLGITFEVEEDQSEGYTLFKIKYPREDSQNLKESLADVVAEIVVEKLESEYISRIIREDYQDFNLDEREKIEKFTLQHLDQGEYNNQFVSRMVRKREIIKQLLDYFDKHQDLNIEGFVRFRLQNYLNQLRKAVDRAVDDYIIENEYNEFIDLLSYFVEIQEPKISLVNVLQLEDGSFQILDINREVINSNYLEGYISEIMEGEVEFEDLLVSALINIAPASIVLHFEDEDVEETVGNIFGDRITICSGCELCEEVRV
ncbi:MAG: sporulation protein YtxC [Bacillota bacterium]